jgi:hypothetical protein
MLDHRPGHVVGLARASAAPVSRADILVPAQRLCFGAQGKTIFDPDFDIDDGGLPHEKPALPPG